MWNGTLIATDYESKNHMRWCSVCSEKILYEYYLYSYGNGEVYEVPKEEGEPRWNSFPTVSNCRKSDGTEITSDNLGVCSTCGYTYTLDNWSGWKDYHSLENKEGKIRCRICKKEFGEISIIENVNSTTPAMVTYTINVKFTNGAKFDSILDVIEYNSYFDDGAFNIININSEKSVVTLECRLKPKSTIKETIYGALRIRCNVSINGVISICDMQETNGIIKPDYISPVISNIQVSGNEWTKSKPITITGTEN